MRNIKNIAYYVEQKMTGETTGHDWYHAERVFKLATYIAKHEKNVDLFIVQAVAFMHDLGDWKVNNSKDTEEQIIQNACHALNLSSKDTANIVKIIPNISYSKNLDSKSKLSIEGKIVQDADRLEALGAIGIARAFAFGGKKQRKIYDPKVGIKEFKTTEEYRNTDSPSINHFYEKLFKIRGMLNTRTAKQIALKRERFMKNFLKEFYDEWNVKL